MLRALVEQVPMSCKTYQASPPKFQIPRLLLGLVGFAMYAACLVLPAYKTAMNGDGVLHWQSGLDMLFWGIVGIFLLQFGWIANPIMIYLLSTLIFSQKNLSASIASISLYLAIFLPGKGHSIIPSWGDHSFGPGYFAWCGCALFLFCIAVYDVLTKKQHV